LPSVARLFGFGLPSGVEQALGQFSHFPWTHLDERGGLLRQPSDKDPHDTACAYDIDVSLDQNRGYAAGGGNPIEAHLSRLA
jgi:hypothetical protein